MKTKFTQNVLNINTCNIDKSLSNKSFFSPGLEKKKRDQEIDEITKVIQFDCSVIFFETLLPSSAENKYCNFFSGYYKPGSTLPTNLYITGRINTTLSVI